MLPAVISTIFYSTPLQCTSVSWHAIFSGVARVLSVQCYDSSNLRILKYELH